MRNNFEKKLNKHKKKNHKCMCAFCSNDSSPIILHTPIDEEPPYKASSHPTLQVGDLVFWKGSASSPDAILQFSVFEESKSAGIVIGSHWMKVETSARFSKREGDWVSDFVCVPHAVVLWNDAETTDIPMELLEKQSGE